MIKNIIFDLGNVIINIDEQKAAKNFADLGFDVSSFYNKENQISLFDDFETGKITGSDFVGALKLMGGNQVSVESIRNAWNSMLLDIPKERIEFLKSISRQYTCFLLSNTNEIHMESIKQMLVDQTGCFIFDEIFDAQYYSYQEGLKKPDTALFEKIIVDHNLNPTTTVFVEDTPGHIAAAEELGIKGFLVHKHTDLLKLGNLLQPAEPIKH